MMILQARQSIVKWILQFHVPPEKGIITFSDVLSKLFCLKQINRTTQQKKSYKN
jgi:hypothetical protein